MEIKEFENIYIEKVVKIWNETCSTKFLYKPFTIESFNRKFIGNPYFQYEGTFVCIENNEVIGFANGIYRTSYLPGESFNTVPGYITMILVREDMRNKGYGKKLLKSVEKFLVKKGKKKVRIDFFNPINLEWVLPGNLMADHPNAPGVDADGLGYGFIKHMAFIEGSVEVSMYRNLNSFIMDNSMIEKYKSLGESGITIEYYDENRHHGLQDFFCNLKHEYWRKEINDNQSNVKSYPILVALDKNKICGFAGPLEIEPSGRGKFSGIGVEPKYQGKGIGKLLFFKLCENFKIEGATFMSLFTGKEGNARRLYESAGFEIVKEWMLFKKEI